MRAFTVVERDPAGWYARMAAWRAETAVKAGAVTRGEAERWLEELRAEQAAGRYLAGQTGLFTWGRRPPCSHGYPQPPAAKRSLGPASATAGSAFPPR